MSKVPRASLCITILDDEDYRILMSSKDGAEAFGIFTAIVLVGRERLQNKKARQLSESESLQFENSTAHVAAMAHVSVRQITECLSLLERVANETGSKPWLYLSESGHLVIRSFFRYNTTTSWGGQRKGAGRRSMQNQDDSSGIQDDSNLNPSRIPSGLGLGIDSITPLAPLGETVCVGESVDPPRMAPPPHKTMVPKVTGPGRESDDAKALEEWAKSLGCDKSHEPYSHWARCSCDYVPAAWIKELLRRNVDGRSGAKRLAIPILNKIIGEWIDEGRCPYLGNASEKPAGASTELRVTHVPPEQQPFIDALYRPKKPKGARR